MVDVWRRFGLRGLAVFLSALAVALLLYQELFTHLSNTGYGDYQFFHHNWEFGRVALSRYHEWPLWNPFYCGGIPDFGDPQTQVHHPLFFLSFLFGTTIALKIFVVLHAVAGLGGMYLYARRIENLAPPAAAFAAGAWAASGFFAWHCGCGHGGFVAFYLLPLVLLAWRAAARDFRFGGAVAALLTLSLLAGGAYVFPYLLLVLAFDTLVRWPARSERRGIVLGMTVSGILTLLVGAWRLIPILAHLRYYGRQRDIVDSLGLRELLDALTRNAAHSDLGQPVAGHPYSWVEYGAFIGWSVVLLALAGAILSLRHKTRRFLIVGVLLFGSLTLGSFARWSPWNVLHKVPVYSSLQAPTRFMFAFLFFVTLLAAIALDRALVRLAEIRPSARVTAIFGWLAAIALLVPIAIHHRGVLAGKWQDPPVPLGQPEPAFFLTFMPGSHDVAAFPPGAILPGRNFGTGHCYTGMDYHPAKGLWAGPTEQVRVSEPGRLEAWGRTTQTAWADVDTPLGGHLIFNQTFAPGWRSEFGPPSTDQMRAALDVPPGRRRVVLRYQPPSLPWALAGSLIGLAAALALARPKIVDFVRASSKRTIAFALGLAVVAIVAYQRGIYASEPQPVIPLASKLVATASDRAERELNRNYVAENAVDGKTFSEWLAPDSAEAWLDVRLEPASPVRTVALLNARNLPHADRGTRRFRVEAYSSGRMLASTDGFFTRTGEEPEWLYLPVGADSADRIRVVVQSWYGLGGGIAEVRVY